MKNKLMYLVAVLFAACVGFSSCSDDDDKDDTPAEFSGTWKFDKTHFVFEYSVDENITIPGIDPMTPEQVTARVVALGNEYMGKYFTGIRFDKKKALTILMKIKEKNEELRATYEIQGLNISITLNKEDLKVLAGKDLPIPTINFKYSIGTDDLTIYMDKASIQPILSAVLLIDLGLTDAQKLILQEINKILSKTTKLEIGATLKR